ncbi:MAG: hypothetical protein A2X86_13795 [Bdellovibrionales bacterium GWA2_49_15]|nr:MAG: hypothetical protein A2X86_13795 [Bdellovibrionales bacterium GWA2_49_15]HAZ13600.1 hypothetical protein [Bdellovibrionales bacterium]
MKDKERDKVWVIVGNSTKAQIYESPEITLNELTLIHEFVNMEGRLHNKELRDFNIGRVHNKNYPRTKGLRPKSTPHEAMVKGFAKTIADYLEKARIDNSFEKLMIVTSPRFLGAIRSFLSKDTKARLWNEIPKELNFEQKKEFVEYFHRGP